MIPVTLRSARLVLDQPAAGDVDAIAEYCTDPLFERYLTIPWPYTREHAEYFVGTRVPEGWASGEGLEWALRSAETGDLLGAIGWRRSLRMIGFWLGAPFRGRGYMPEAVTTVADWLFAEHGQSELRWECVAGNAASATVARKTGFTYTGTGPADVHARDGSRPESWHGVLAATDPRGEKPGWPV